MSMEVAAPDAVEAAPVPAPEAVPAPAADVEAPPPADAGEPDAETPPAPTRAQQLAALLDEVDPAELDEVAKHPKVAGKIDSAADRLTKQRADDARAIQERAELLEAARQGDLVKLGEVKARELQPDLDAESEAPVREKVFGHVKSAVKAFAEELPEPVRQALAGKEYAGDYATGLKSYMKDVVSRAVDVEIERRKPTLLKEWLGASREGEPSPDLGGGTAQTGQQFGSWFDVSQALMDGRVTTAFARDWRAKHGER